MEKISKNLNLQIQGLQADIDQAATRVDSWIQDAVGDMADAYRHSFFGSEYRKKVDQAKKDGVIDIKGWLADEYYNDVAILRDMLGDRVFDEACSITRDSNSPAFELVYIEICKKMKESAHKAMKAALDMLIEDHSERYEKQIGIKS